MTVKTETAAPERSRGTTQPAPRSMPTHRKRVLTGIAVYAIGRLPMDRRFQRTVILAAIALAAAKRILQQDATQSFKRLSAWTERNYRREREHLRAAEHQAAAEVHGAAARRPHRQ